MIPAKTIVVARLTGGVKRRCAGLPDSVWTELDQNYCVGEISLPLQGVGLHTETSP
jgi:hypothetical protein